MYEYAGWQLSIGTAFGDQGRDICVDNNTIDGIMFVNAPYMRGVENDMFPFIRPMLFSIEEALQSRIKTLNRIKINHTSPLPNFTSNNYNTPHSDDGNPIWTSLLYYVNDSDGDTFLFNEEYSHTASVTNLTLNKRITPQMGKAVVFPSRQFHAGSNPIVTPSRFIINFVFELEK
jgi:hypothetical protein